MGIISIKVKVSNPADSGKVREVACLVDTGAVYTLVPGDILESLGIKPHSERTFFLANGDEITRKMGTAAFEYQGRRGDSLVIFGEEGDNPLLGATTLEGFGLIIDPFTRELKPLPMVLCPTGEGPGPRGRRPIVTDFLGRYQLCGPTQVHFQASWHRIRT